jgi:RNA polymerase sigma-70 factor (ECF subfamily)
LTEEAKKLALFEQIIVPHLNSAYNLARWLTGNEHDAEDVVQEAYLRAFRFFDGFKGEEGKGWLLAVVRNTCRTWVRRQKGDIPKVVFDEQIHGKNREEASAESDLIEKARLGSLRECLELLPVDYRGVLVMREMEELSYKEIADIAGLPLGTVMSRLSRARKRLEDCLTTRINGASK